VYILKVPSNNDSAVTLTCLERTSFWLMLILLMFLLFTFSDASQVFAESRWIVFKLFVELSVVLELVMITPFFIPPPKCRVFTGD
jgi:hypothetical protein